MVNCKNVVQKLSRNCPEIVQKFLDKISGQIMDIRFMDMLDGGHMLHGSRLSDSKSEKCGLSVQAVPIIMGKKAATAAKSAAKSGQASQYHTKQVYTQYCIAPG